MYLAKSLGLDQVVRIKQFAILHAEDLLAGVQKCLHVLLVQKLLQATNTTLVRNNITAAYYNAATSRDRRFAIIYNSIRQQ